MPNALNVLILERNSADIDLAVRELRRAGVDPAWRTAETELHYMAQLEWGPELIIASAELPTLDVTRALKLLHQSGKSAPFIVFCGISSVGIAEAALSLGAADYAFKEHPGRLGWSTRRILKIAEMQNHSNRLEESLRRVESRLHAMLTYTPSVVFSKDVEGRYTMVNPQFEKLLGRSSAEVIGRRNVDLFDREQADRFDAHDQRVLDTKEPVELEETFRIPGKERTFLVSRFPVRDADSQVTGVAAICIDLTERKRAELALRQSEELYRGVVEGAMEGLAIHQDGIIRFVNRAAVRLSGYEHAQDLVGRNIWETFVAPEARADLQARCAACLRGEVQSMHTGWPGVRKDGSRIWVQSSVVPITWRGQPALLTYFSDITERRRTEEFLRKSEERFSKAFHGSPSPVSIVTLEEGRYIDANVSLLQMLGRTRDEVIGRTVADLNLWVDTAERSTFARLAAEHQVVRNFETRLRVKSGDIRDVLISAELIQLGSERCMIVVTQDVTERKRAEEALRELEEQFRQAQKMEAVGQLAGGIAHDFNNLLTIIQGHAALLTSEESASASTKSSAEQIVLASERAAALVRQLLTFSRRQVMQLWDVDVNEIVDRTGRMLRRILGEDIALLFRLAPVLPRVPADGGMIEQVLMNLAVNSRDAMPKGGKLIIGTALREIDEKMARHAAEARPGPAICIAITDTGCGIPPENMHRLFEPFFTTKSVGKGTGLGLATAYGIVKQHQGWFQVSSVVGRGTTFRVFLPLGGQDAPAPRLPTLEPSVAGGTEGILLVEDEENLRNLVKNILSRLGYRVFEADSGQCALEVWAQSKESIDLLLTDIVMPNGMTGRELAKMLQAEQPGLKVIFTSGYSRDVIAQDVVLEHGINFLQKPYEPRLLASMVRSCLDGGA